MAYSAKYGKLGFECDVCGNYFPGLFLMETCRKCEKQICPLCRRIRLSQSRSYFGLHRRLKFEKPEYVCPDCAADLESEEIKAQAEKEEESSRPITTCQICGADDSPPEYKIFGYSPPYFLNCDRCGRLGCDNCITGSPEPHYEYDVICRDCYKTLEEEETREREEHWREEEENKLED